MFKWLKDWLFATEDEQVKEVRVYDFIERRENGHDVTLRVIGDGDYAEAMVFLTLGDLPPVTYGLRSDDSQGSGVDIASS